MKNKIITVILVLFLVPGKGFSQDTTHSTKPDKQVAYSHHNIISKNSKVPATQKHHQKIIAKTQFYRDTRLGSSSKQYDTYRKNDKGAGAITTNPNK